MDDLWDCVIVGGGAAGLSAGLVLGRARRRTLLVDAGNQSNLAAHGIAVAPGAPFLVNPGGADHVRVTAGLVRDGFDDLASILASAAGSVQRGSGPRTHAHPRGWR